MRSQIRNSFGSESLDPPFGEKLENFLMTLCLVIKYSHEKLNGRDLIAREKRRSLGDNHEIVFLFGIRFSDIRLFAGC